MLLGVSRDRVEAQKKFKEKVSAPFHFLSDAEETVVKAYGVLVEKNLYGKVSMGIERSTFLIDPAGKVQKVWRKVKVDGHVAEVLASLS